MPLGEPVTLIISRAEDMCFPSRSAVGSSRQLEDWGPGNKMGWVDSLECPPGRRRWKTSQVGDESKLTCRGQGHPGLSETPARHSPYQRCFGNLTPSRTKGYWLLSVREEHFLSVFLLTSGQPGRRCSTPTSQGPCIDLVRTIHPVLSH